MKRIKTTLIVFLFLFVAGNSFGQNRPTHELHSMMIYNFLKYIQWPGDLNTGNFVIGVIGDDEVYSTLNSWYGNKQQGGKKIIIKKFNSVGEIANCQLLYVGDRASNKFDDIHGKIASQPVLSITGKNGLGAKGSCINFKVVNNRLKFELNQAAVDQSKLKISSQLSAMAILI